MGKQQWWIQAMHVQIALTCWLEVKAFYHRQNVKGDVNCHLEYAWLLDKNQGCTESPMMTGSSMPSAKVTFLCHP